jgi:hypothetical protein
MGRHSCRPTPSSIPTGPSPPPGGGGGSPPRRQHRNEATTGLLRGYYESYYEATTRLLRGYYAATTRLLPGHYQATTRLLRCYYQEPHAHHSASSTAAGAPLVCRRRSSWQLEAGVDDPHTERKISTRPYLILSISISIPELPAAQRRGGTPRSSHPHFQSTFATAACSDGLCSSPARRRSALVRAQLAHSRSPVRPTSRSRRGSVGSSGLRDRPWRRLRLAPQTRAH